MSLYMKDLNCSADSPHFRPFVSFAISRPIPLAIAAGFFFAPVCPPLYSHHFMVFGTRSMLAKNLNFCEHQAAYVKHSTLAFRLWCLSQYRRS